MIPTLLSLLTPAALAFDPAPWDACADGDGAACWQLTQSLPLEDGALSARAESLRLEGCTLGHDPACSALIQALPERRQWEDTLPLVQGCLAGGDETCAWVQDNVNADLAIRQAQHLCEERGCSVDASLFLPPGWLLLDEPRMGHLQDDPIGRWSIKRVHAGTSLDRGAESVWLSAYTGSSAGQTGRLMETFDRQPFLWHIDTGEVTPPQDWCPEPLVCAPDAPAPTDPGWLERALADYTESYSYVRLIGESIWLNRAERSDRQTGAITQQGEIRVLRADTPDRVLEQHGQLTLLSAERVLVQNRSKSWLYSADGEFLATFPVTGPAALSPDGSALLIDQVLIDLSSLEASVDTPLRCSRVSWGEGGAYCFSSAGLLFHPHPAGARREMTPPGGWEAYGRVEITVPELLEGQSLELQSSRLSSSGHTRPLGSPGSTHTVWVGDHVEFLAITLISEDTVPGVPRLQTYTVPAPRPGESLSLTPQVRSLPLTLPGCAGAVETGATARRHHPNWTPLHPDCSVEMPGLLVGAQVTFHAREVPISRQWRSQQSVPASGAVVLETLGEPKGAAGLDFSGAPQTYSRGVLAWTDVDGQTTEVGRTRYRQVAGTEPDGMLVLRQGSASEIVDIRGDYAGFHLGPGTWEGAVLTSEHATPIRIDNDSPEVVWLTADPQPATSSVRVLGQDGLPVVGAQISVALDGQEPVWGELPHYTRTLYLETDLAGRVQIPDPGWPLWVWGQGWMQRVAPGEHHIVQQGPTIHEQRGINAILEPTPYGLQVVAGVCIEEHWLEKGDTLVELCGEPLAGRGEWTVERLLLSSPTQSCEARVLKESGLEKVGRLSVDTTSPFFLPESLPADRPRLETPEYEAWKSTWQAMAPVERCGPPLTAELLDAELAITVLEPGDPALLLQDAAQVELDFVVWYPNGTPGAARLGEESWPQELPDWISGRQLRPGGPRFPRSVLMAAKEHGVGARLRVWFQTFSSNHTWLVADVHIRALTAE